MNFTQFRGTRDEPTPKVTDAKRSIEHFNMSITPSPANGKMTSTDIVPGDSDHNLPTSGSGSESSEEETETISHQISAPAEDNDSDGASRELVSSSDGSDDEDDEPPLLKYTRLNQLPPNLFQNDPVSASAFHDNVFVFGTHSGYILLTTPEFAVIRTFKAHRASILSLYTDGLWFASASMDGTVVIGSIADGSDIVMFDYKRPIHAVILDKNYQRTRSFICGGMSGKVVYSSKNWLDQRVDTILDQEKGPIVAIQMIDDLVLWMNDVGITIYHTTSRQVISVIEKPDDSFRSDLYWPRISFPETDRLLIAWGNYIWSLRASVKGPINSNSGAGSSMKSRILPAAASLSFRSSYQEKKVEVEHMFKVDYLIAGIASFKDDQWIVLAYNQSENHPKSGRPVPQNPDVKILSSVDASTQHEEEIGFNFTENLGLNDYNLGVHIGAKVTRFFIICARDGVVAEQVQLDDRLSWCLERELYHEAWSMSRYLVPPTKRLEFGVQHLRGLVNKQHWEDAASWLKELLYFDTDEFPLTDTRSTIGTRVTNALGAEEREALVKEIRIQWEEWSRVFIEAGQTKRISEVIPTDPRWNLDKSIFSRIIKFWLLESIEVAVKLLRDWDLELYNVKDVTTSIEGILEEEPRNNELRSALCQVYEKSFEPGKAVLHLYALKDPKIVEFLDKHHILTSFINDIPKFVKLRFANESDIERLPISQIKSELLDIVKILVGKRNEISSKTVLALMFREHLDIINFFYLEELIKIDELLVKGYENERIQLYSQYSRPQLFPFLISNQAYDISRAIEICEANALVDELVYLLGRIGQNKKALKLIVEELEDPEKAINFAKRQNDQETWNTVLDYSFSRPKYIKALIELSDETSSKFYNPITILQNMSPNLQIEGLKESITTVSRENDMNVVLNQLILKIVYKRSEEISQDFYLDKLKGVEFDIKSGPLKNMFAKFETSVVLKTPGASEITIQLVNDVIGDDPSANRPYSDLATKLEHLQMIHKRYQERTWNI